MIIRYYVSEYYTDGKLEDELYMCIVGSKKEAEEYIANIAPDGDYIEVSKDSKYINISNKEVYERFFVRRVGVKKYETLAYKYNSILIPEASDYYRETIEKRCKIM